ncbi:matrixin family metalloprotease [Paenibacillus sp. FSL R10-2736]|uniref:matrixin family metalloprotease n=1 Tax=Paenibacillus sp. FSL R10-2736 TaxID=2954692 RepID=UPI0030F5D9DC
MSKKQFRKHFVLAGSLILLVSSSGTSFAAYQHDILSRIWSQGKSSVTYYAQSTFDAATKTQIQTAMSEWNNALPSGNFMYKSAADTNDTQPSQNSIFTITKYPYGATSYTIENNFYLSSNIVIESDLRVNSSLNWANSPKPDYYDIQSSFTHEFGHTLRVDHSPVYEDTMFGSSSTNTDYKRTLTAADREAAQYSVSRWKSNLFKTTDNDESSDSTNKGKIIIHSEPEVIQYDKNQLVNEADVIVSGKVISQEVVKDFEGFPVTDTLIRVQTVFKGEPGETVEIRVNGGETDDILYTLDESAAPTFKVGEEAVVFLSSNKGLRPDKDDFGYYLVGQAQGKFILGGIQPKDIIENNTDTQSFDFNNFQNEINNLEQYNNEYEIPRSYLPEGEESKI